MERNQAHSQMWTKVRKLGELLSKRQEWDTFDWLSKTLGEDCNNTRAAAKMLSYDRELKHCIRGIHEAYAKVDKIEKELGIEEWTK